MTVDERIYEIWNHVSKIANEDPEFARSLVNLESVPQWLRDKLNQNEEKIVISKLKNQITNVDSMTLLWYQLQNGEVKN